MIKTSVWLLFALSVSLVLTAVALPAHTLAWLRSDYHWFGQSLNWLEAISPNIDLSHVILFATASFLLSVLWRRSPWWQVPIWMLVLAMASELLQYLIPGRNPLLSDLHDDLLGALIGFVMALPARWHAKPP